MIVEMEFFIHIFIINQKKTYCNCHGIKINMNNVIYQLEKQIYEKNRPESYNLKMKELLLEYDSD